MGQLTYTTQEVQDRLDAVGTFVRPNLLDNAYFVGGGSQQGGGQFPINQRGQTTYSSQGAYSIDRWLIYARGSNGLAVQSDGIALSPNSSSSFSSGPFFAQLTENPADLYGKTVTFSALVSCPSGTSGKLQICSTNYNNIKSTNFSSGTQLVSVTATNLPTNYIGVAVVMNKSSTSAVKIMAMKLEIGDIQTIAHWDETAQKWVLNEVPNYQQELAKCQRYCYLNAKGMSQFVRAANVATNAIYFDLPLPVPMRAPVTYTALSSGKMSLHAMISGTEQTGVTFSVQYGYGGSLRITATKTSHGLSDAYLNVANILFSSDL